MSNQTELKDIVRIRNDIVEYKLRRYEYQRKVVYAEEKLIELNQELDKCLNRLELREKNGRKKIA